MRIEYIPLGVQVALLTHQHTWYCGCASIIQDLIINSLNHLETRARSNGIHEYVTMNTYCMLRVQDRVFVLPCCIDNIALEVLSAVLDGFLKHILNRWVIGIHESIFHKSNNQRRFTLTPLVYVVRSRDMRTGRFQQPDVVLKLDPVCTHVPTDRDPSTAIFRFLDSCCEPVGDMSGKAPHQATQIQDAKIKNILLAVATDKYNYKAAARSLAPVVAAAAAAAPECVEGGERARGPPQRRNWHAQLRRWTGGLAACRPVIADTHTHTHTHTHIQSLVLCVATQVEAPVVTCLA